MSSNKKAIKGHKITLKNTSAKASSLTAKIQNMQNHLLHSQSSGMLMTYSNIQEPQLICIDDEEDVIACQPTKKIKEDVFEEEQQLQPMFNGTKLSFKDCLKQVEQNEELKVLRLNHFFKRDGEIYFEVMVGASPENMLREPQIMSYTSLISNKETKLMVFHYIASVCKSTVIEEQAFSQSTPDKEK